MFLSLFCGLETARAVNRYDRNADGITTYHLTGLPEAGKPEIKKLFLEGTTRNKMGIYWNKVTPPFIASVYDRMREGKLFLAAPVIAETL